MPLQTGAARMVGHAAGRGGCSAQTAASCVAGCPLRLRHSAGRPTLPRSHGRSGVL